MKKLLIILTILSLLVVAGCGLEDTDKNFPQPSDYECVIDEQCMVSGCSSQLCLPEGSDVVTTCEYLSEYGCYQEANCGCFENKCQWEPTDELSECINNAQNTDVVALG